MTKPIIVVKICYKLLYVIQVVKKILISNFLASTDIKVFGRTYLFAMLFLIGLALFLHPGCFCLAYHYFFGSINRLLLASSREVLHGHNLYLPSTQYCKLNFEA